MNRILRGAAVAALILGLGLCGNGVADDQLNGSAALPAEAAEEIKEMESTEEAVSPENAEEAEQAAAVPETADADAQADDKATGEAAVGEGSEDNNAEEAADGSSDAADEAFCVLEADWNDSDIQSIFARDVVATITDVRTGISWQEVRKGGTRHADVQPCTASDTARLKKVYGGDWSWKRRAIWVTIDGKTYAASMNGMPHGQGSVSGNKFDGHHCIHFTNSRTHSSNKIDTNHQKMIRRALEAAQ